MSTHLLIEMMDRVTAIVVVGVIVRAPASVLRTWIEERFRTRRLSEALKGTKPNQRSEIIVAFGRFEGGLPDESSNDAPDVRLSDQRWWLLPLLMF